jgi:glutamine amidotransferase|tara:strand:+ start:2584 stop:3228 length:645 start_codon:yes stop_codon:yes gene_type:complete
MINSITIVDYGIGNLFSVNRSLEVCCDKKIKISGKPSDILSSDMIILPGVGAFANAIRELERKDLIHPIQEHVSKGNPILGICLGLQLFASSSEEFGRHLGLDIIPGVVSKIPNQSQDSSLLKIPYIGWAKQEIIHHNEEFNFLDEFKEKVMYTIHSFQFKPCSSYHLLAQYDYGGNKITSIVGKDNIIGVQFHPEKSGKFGLSFLQRLIQNLG